MNARLGRCIGTTLLLVGRMSALDTPVAPAVESTPRPEPSSATTITFSEHVAPIIFSRCAPCHRPGEAAPFDLLSFEQVQKRGRQIVEVTRSRYMPPWPPDPGPLKLTGERRLPDREVELIARWVEGGMQRGDSSRLPPQPAWTEGWALGEPDLVLEMPAAYQLAADGLDVYRNFVVPAPVRERRYIRALEFRPESRAVHHVFIKVDPSPQSRLRDELDEEPGFPGFYVESARMPEGQFVTWQPGKGASTAPPGMPWVLEPECDVIIQTHLQPIGRAETIRSRIGLYFTNQPPVRSPFKLALMSFQIDIPPGATNHLVTDSFVMPVDADLLAVLPHGHLLGKSFAAEANLPDGGSLPLLSISDWDFNWQGDYSYREPVFLPRGTVVQMRYTFDNSTNNLRNPHAPPQRVRYGPNSTDEMAEFWLQLLPRNPADLSILAENYNRTNFLRITDYNERLVRERPDDFPARIKLGRARLAQGRFDEARAVVEKALTLQPDSDDAHYLLGVLARMQNRLTDAEREFEAAIRLNPANARAHGNLGLVLMQRNQPEQAQAHLERALQLNPQDEIARSALDRILKR